MFLVLGEARVAAVDHQVAGLQLLAQFGDDRVGDIAGRDHHPDQARNRHGRNELVDGGHIGHVGVAVVARDLNAALAQPFAHVETHFAKADQSDVHGVSSFLRWCGGGLRGAPNWVALGVVLGAHNESSAT